MARRVGWLSERDRVRAGSLPVGTEFCWRGARWVVFDGPFGAEIGRDARFDGGGPSVEPVACTRVRVSRSSGAALGALRAGAPKDPCGVRSRDGLGCTEPERHGGRHRAVLGERVLAVWDG